MRAIEITEFGGPEVLRLVERPAPEAGAGTVLVQVTAIGVNYADTHTVENSYLAPASLPLVPGGEVAGTTPDGTRVVGVTGSGGYAEQAAVPRAATFPIPDGVSDAQALALIVQGTTAWHLLRTSARMQPGESVVVHAAAGGVGSLAVQLAKLWGAGRVIATGSSEEKRGLALELGADVAVDVASEDLKGVIEEANGGRKVDIVLEMTGGPVTDASLAALARFGRLAYYGQAGRVPATPIDPAALMRRSRAVVGFWLVDCMVDPSRLLGEPLTELFGLVIAGDLRPVIGGTYPLSRAADALRALLARTTTGKLVLDPSR